MRFLLLSLLVGALVFTTYADNHMDDTGDQEEEAEEADQQEVELEPDTEGEGDGEDDGAEEDDEAKGEDHGKKAAKKSHHTWSYNIDDGKTGPAMWNELFPDKCGEKMQRQSPINIKVDNAKHDERLADISIIEPPVNDTEKRMYLYNNGHVAQLDVENAGLYVIGGNLGSEYKVAQLHFHWGSTDAKGSEHQVNDKQFPLEMHVVTYDSEKYSSLSEAVTGDNSLAVFGTLFRVVKRSNPNLERVVERLRDVTKPGKDHKQQIPWFNIRSLMPPTTSKYFRYEGSLTTPTCDQSVVWTVFALPNYVGTGQLEQFRNLIEGTNEHGETVQLADNWREPQPLHSRQVTMSFVPEAEYELAKKKKQEYKEAAGKDNMASVMSISLPITLLCLLISKITKH